MILVNSNLLDRALNTQKRCYKFLQLIKEDELPLTGHWSIGRIHDNSLTEFERIKELIAAHYVSIPEDSRPITTQEKDMNEFANFFNSYLFCSFDYVSNDTRLVPSADSSSDSYCWCELCTRLTDAPNLKLKKVTNWDKGIADSLEEEAIRKLISKQNIAISEAKIDDTLKDTKISESRALITYGIELIRRCEGQDVDTSSLVLWRRFAWEKGGVVKKNFVLTIEMFELAETQIILHLSSLQVD